MNVIITTLWFTFLSLIIGFFTIILEYSIELAIILTVLVYFSLWILYGLYEIERKLDFIWEKIK